MKRSKIALFAVLMMYSAITSAQTKDVIPPPPPDAPMPPLPPPAKFDEMQTWLLQTPPIPPVPLVKPVPPKQIKFPLPPPPPPALPKNR